MKKLICLQFFILIFLVSMSQEFVPNYDETKVPDYTLPDPLVLDDGSPVKDKKDWEKRRKEIYHVFEKEIYGKAPEWNGDIKSILISHKEDAVDGLATRKEVCLELTNGNHKRKLMLLIYLPHNVKDAPVFLGYNFNGNHTVTTDPDIIITDLWVRNKKAIGTTDHRASETGRGKAASKWPVKEIISRGFGLVTLYYGDADPDYDDGFKNGVHQLYDSPRDGSSWGSIAAWAWGLSRVMDYFETIGEINVNKVIVMGHSRLGKTALWAGASDLRFAMVISNNSGCLGAAISRRMFGETFEWFNDNNPHWSCDNFKKYSNKEELLPVDQHELIALIAPRPVYVASAGEDLWADPKGEFLSCVHASPVYELLGMKGLSKTEMPSLNEPIFGNISYHIRTGKHDVTLYDWICYMNYATLYFNK